MTLAQIAKADILANLDPIVEMNPAVANQAHPPIHHVFFQFEPRNAIDHQPTRAIIAIIDMNLITLGAELFRRRQTRRPRPNNPDRLRLVCDGGDRLDPAFFPRGFCQEFFNRPNRHCPMPGLLDHAGTFAKSILWTDSPANFGKVIGRLRQTPRFLETPLRGEHQPIRNGIRQRTMHLTKGHPTL